MSEGTTVDPLELILEALKGICARLVNDPLVSKITSTDISSGNGSPHLEACRNVVNQVVTGTLTEKHLVNADAVGRHLEGVAMETRSTRTNSTRFGEYYEGHLVRDTRPFIQAHSCSLKVLVLKAELRKLCELRELKAEARVTDIELAEIIRAKELELAESIRDKALIGWIVVFQDEYANTPNSGLCNFKVVLAGVWISAESIFQALKLLILHAIRAETMETTPQTLAMSQKEVDAKALELLGMAPLDAARCVRSIQLKQESFDTWNSEFAPAAMFAAMLIVANICPEVYDGYNPRTAFVETTDGTAPTPWGVNRAGVGGNVCGMCASAIAHLRSGRRDEISPLILDLYDAVCAKVPPS